MTPITLAALGWLLAAIAMAALWAWERFPALNRVGPAPEVRDSDATAAEPRSDPRNAIVDAGWTALVAGLAILYANVGGGAWARRSAIGWMMGSWGARLMVQRLYAPRLLSETDRARSFWFFQAKGASALFFSLPAVVVSVNPDPNLSSVELAACGLWIVGFAGETTADRQLLRFTSNPANAGLVCRAGLWRLLRNATDVFEGMIWVAYALFAFASPWGWIAFACPAVMAYRLGMCRAFLQRLWT
jgi:steroid 5-alpha reductase family enzyme